jgi:hypothetical protein
MNGPVCTPHLLAAGPVREIPTLEGYHFHRYILDLTKSKLNTIATVVRLG